MEERKLRGRPKATSSLAEQEMDRAQEQLDAFESNVKDLTLDRMNMAPKQETEQQTKLSAEDIEKSKRIYLKPKRTIGPGVNPKTGEREKFNEKFRAEYEFAKEYVQFIAENKEIIGEQISDIWTKPFPGTNCESWDVPVNKPIWGPRYLAEQIKKCQYHRLTMQENKIVSSDGMGQYYGSMAVDTIVNRIDAHPVNTQKSFFMGSSSFK